MNDYFLGPVSNQARLIAILGSIILALVVVGLVRKGFLKAGYSLLWFLMATAILVLSLFSPALFILSNILGVYYAPAAIFAVLLLILILISIHFSVVISRHERRIKTMAQEIALLKNKLSKKRE